MKLYQIRKILQKEPMLFLSKKKAEKYMQDKIKDKFNYTIEEVKTI